MDKLTITLQFDDGETGKSVSTKGQIDLTGNILLKDLENDVRDLTRQCFQNLLKWYVIRNDLEVIKIKK